ncbi:MAG TPA: hypothetical protein VK778_07530 [Solirubrobacteraceae bacterium]|nr:hypothetical protein [Solirubrobacteraceae bacterium]
MACATAIATVALAGCGSTGGAGDAVAVVAGTPITKAALRHWTAVKLAIDYEANPRKPLPSGVVYEPSDYAPCIAHLRALARAAAERAASGFTVNVVRLPASAKNPKGRLSFVKRATKPAKPGPIPTSAQLERECAEHYRSVEMGMLNVLIGFQWELQEGKADGVSPSEAEVREEYARYSRKQFPNRGEQQRHLADTGESVADELLRVRTDMISGRIFKQATRRFGGIATKAELQAYGRWAVETEKQWVARTSCRAGYIVEGCKQYRTA